MTNLDICKRAALAILDREDLGDRRIDYAMHEMIDQLHSYPELADHIGISIGIAKMQNREITTVEQARDFINGFN